MPRVLVSGLINIETTLRTDGFPIHYQPVRYPFFGVNTTVSGVGYNVAKALTVLGVEVDFLSLVGQDLAGELVLRQLVRDGIPSGGVVQRLAVTPQSVIAFAPDGGRMIFTDLKDIQETTYPGSATLDRGGYDLAVLCNINFSRPMLAQAQAAGVPVAVDVHALGSLEDSYNQDFMAAAQVLFMSHEHLPEAPENWVRRVHARFGCGVIVIGLGAKGALLFEATKNEATHLPAVYTRPVVNTIGAGDALFSAFCAGFASGLAPLDALRRAVVFASYKVGANGGAEGFLDAAGLDAWVSWLG